ncbi:MAG: SprT-like domain-containing protein [Planctomycetes bacterium]|nr:SprT-like domain-containing protein [Planctomycetota bacterium]
MSLPSADELRQRASELLQQWRVNDTAIAVRWNRRLTTTAGRAFPIGGRVELNPRLLARAPEQLEMVLVHEVAHIAVHRLFGPNVPAHGRHWRSLMAHAGQPPAVTHDIPVHDLRRSRRRWLYLRLCDACSARAIGDTVSHGRCAACGVRERFLVLRAPAGARGRAALMRLTAADIRSRCRR